MIIFSVAIAIFGSRLLSGTFQTSHSSDKHWRAASRVKPFYEPITLYSSSLNGEKLR